MHRLLRFYTLGLALLAVSSVSLQAEHPIVKWEDWPLIRTGVKIKSFSSYNPTGRTFRDFMNYTRKDNAGYELAWLKDTSGMLVQVWFTDIGERYSPKQFENVRLFLSANGVPHYDKIRDDYFSRSSYPHLQPLWGRAFRARWAFPGLTFNDEFKVTCSAVPHWYQFTCHVYRESRFSEALSDSQIVAVNTMIAQKSGDFPGSDRGSKQSKGKLLLEKNTSRSLLDLDDPGVIRTIRLRPSDVSSDVLDHVRLIVTVDEEATPAINVPLSVFFGGYEEAPIANAQSLPCGYDGQWLYFYFPMPFWKSMDMSLVGPSDRKVEIDYEIGYSDNNPYPRQTAGTLRIQYNDGVSVQKGQPDFAHLKIEGSGHIIGASANLAGSIEGNFRTYIDGMKTPSIETTGGEDYFCHAFGIKVGLLTPFHGGLKEKVGYRFHIMDYVPFLNSIYFGQDHAHDRTHDRDGVFRSAVFYYWNPKSYLVLTDHLDVGDAVSEQSHSYEIDGHTKRLQEDVAGYEGNFDRTFADSGRWTNGETSFRAILDPANDGVRLRKRINQLAYHQAVKVVVDGEWVGTWFEKGSNYELFHEKKHVPGYDPDWKSIDKRFRDSEFEIPAKFTKGKSTIHLRMTTLGSEAALDQDDAGMTNEYFYWIYSYIVPE